MYELVSPVNRAAVLKYLGLVMIGMGAVLFVPLVVAVLFGSYTVAAAYATIAVCVIVAGYGMYRMLPDADLEWKDALVIAALIFPLSSAISAIPISISTGMPLLDSLFEAVSGLTTTGLSVAPDGGDPVFLFARSWLQWIGGIGIVLIVLSVVIDPGTSAYRLYSINFAGKKLRPNVIGAAKTLGSIYLGITLIALFLLIAAGMPPFDALCHAFASVSTGGFSTKDDSIAGFSGILIPATVLLGCVLGAINFGLYPRLIENPRLLLSSEQVRGFLVVLAAGVLMLAFTMQECGTFSFVAGAAAFQALSALTTAGFSTIDVGALPESAKFVLSALMWIGGSVGSTAGGIKILRLILLAKIIHLVFIRFFLPREALTPFKIEGEVVESGEVSTILTFVLLYILVIVVSVLVFTLHGIGTGDALFEVSSALGTVGLSAGVTSAAMAPLLKVVLIADMLLGRMEIIPLCILLFPRTWIRLPPVRENGGRIAGGSNP
ncbi:MAG: TrkH family potassium uptake protein [Methanomicrobiaceae archaeon]|nr:TrkH family potassium uptake protein [Methanomicrobiaceae archaeon]